MQKDIIIEGIKTNNLKNIDVRIVKNGINLIIGPSGSGKSSLAYDTIAEIGVHNLNSMYADTVTEPKYKVKAFENIITTIPIKQLNNNNNIHSTIGTYFNISQYISVIFSSILKMDYDFFVLNKKENVCDKCYGLGYIRELDINKLIDYDKSIKDVPIKCWNRNKDFYSSILQYYCLDNGIDYSKKIKDISKEDFNKIIYGVSDKKYSIKYTTVGRIASRTTRYYGIMTKESMMVNFEPTQGFYSEIVCPKCCGEKYEKTHRDYKIKGLSIGEVLCLPFIDLVVWLNYIKDNYKGDLSFAIQQIYSFVSKAIELNLGYLSFNRSIPSLSGGELQRLRLVQVFISQLTDLLIVLDEPLAGLSSREKRIVYNNIILLSRKHTLLIVDHNSLFYDIAANIIAIGEKSGVLGGHLIDAAKYIKSQQQKFDIKVLASDKELELKCSNIVYNYIGFDITISVNRMNIITGSSGIGKSTLLREYLPQVLSNYTYINQKSLLGNTHSFVATVLGIFNHIITMFATKFKKDKNFFSNIEGADGACPVCNGKGKLYYGSDFIDKLIVTCKECEGTGFNKVLKKYRINDNSIFDIWNMTITEALDFYRNTNHKISSVLEDAEELLLGHLKIGQTTSSLSGGENIRIKVLKSLKSTSEFYGIDEPFRGLNNYEIYKVATFLSNLINYGKTIIVVDHTESALKYFTRHISITNKNGFLIEE